jgi:hypothetical protein
MSALEEKHFARVIHIAHTREFLRLRTVPSQRVRVLYVAPRSHVTRRGLTGPPLGLGRWDGTSIVVESRWPAVSLWFRLPLRETGDTRLERFSLRAGRYFDYQALYGPADQPKAPDWFEVTLTRCSPD